MLDIFESWEMFALLWLSSCVIMTAAVEYNKLPCVYIILTEVEHSACLAMEKTKKQKQKQKLIIVFEDLPTPEFVFIP